MDDVTSGFNIGDNLSLLPAFEAVLGFTEQEVLELLHYYKAENALEGDVDQHIALMREWYNHYRFSKKGQTSVYNTDMVLYYVKNALRNHGDVEPLIDQNIKIDYSKLRHLLLVNQNYRQRLNGNFDLLREITQQEGIASQVVQSFPLERLSARENFISLLYYFGLLTHSESELNKGYCDILLEPFSAKYPEIQHAFLIELKYIPGSLPEADLPQATEKAKNAAAAQLIQYSQDAALQQRNTGKTLHRLVLVYYGWELVLSEGA